MENEKVFTEIDFDRAVEIIKKSAEIKKRMDKQTKVAHEMAKKPSVNNRLVEEWLKMKSPSPPVVPMASGAITSMADIVDPASLEPPKDIIIEKEGYFIQQRLVTTSKGHQETRYFVLPHGAAIGLDEKVRSAQCWGYRDCDGAIRACRYVSQKKFQLDK